MKIGLGIAFGAWSAFNLAHASLIVLVMVAPLIAWLDFTTRRIPESISLPWLAFALTIALLRLPASATALLETAIAAAIICVMSLAGIVSHKHVLGIADAVVLLAILATLCDDQTFPAASVFVTMVLVIVAAALIAIALNAFQRRPLSAAAPVGGSLAIGAVVLAIPAWLLAR